LAENEAIVAAVVALQLQQQEHSILIPGAKRVEYVMVEHDAWPSEEVQTRGVMLPCGGGDLHDFNIHQRLLKHLICTTADFRHAVEAAASPGSHAAFPERAVSPAALSHPTPLGWQR